MKQSNSDTCTTLARLHADRARVAEQLTALNASSAKLRDAANAEAAVLQEMRELGSADIAAMTAWAGGGCAGDAPGPDQTQRRALAEKLAAAQATAASARGAGADIDSQIVQLNAELLEIGSAIETAALDIVQDEFKKASAEHFTATERFRKSTAKLMGLCSLLSQEGRNRIDRGDENGGRMYLQRAATLTGRLPEPGTNQPEIIEAARDWSLRIAFLRQGPHS